MIHALATDVSTVTITIPPSSATCLSWFDDSVWSWIIRCANSCTSAREAAVSAPDGWP